MRLLGPALAFTAALSAGRPALAQEDIGPDARTRGGWTTVLKRRSLLSPFEKDAPAPPDVKSSEEVRRALKSKGGLRAGALSEILRALPQPGRKAGPPPSVPTVPPPRLGRR